MKNIIIILCLFMCSCSLTKNKESDSEINNVCEDLKQNQKIIAVIDCQLGIIIAVNNFKKQLYNNITRNELDSAWAECEKLKEKYK